MFEGIKNTIFKKEIKVCFKKTPWQLTLQYKNSVQKVFIHFPTHKEAKDQEDICTKLGWTSCGIEWKV